MNPNQLSTILRRIAAKIDNSSNPSRELVIAELRKVVMAMGANCPLCEGTHEALINETWIDCPECGPAPSEPVPESEFAPAPTQGKRPNHPPTQEEFERWGEPD